jgi:hypothetical protein
MPDSFDDFEQIDSCYRATEERNRRKLVKDAKPEWHLLKCSVSRLALEGKGYEGHKFEWSSSSSQSDSLRLKNVSVTFLDEGERDGILACSLQFAGMPIRRGNVAVENGSPLGPVEWFLRPVLVDEGGVGWFVCELGQTFSSAELAEEIVKELSRYYKAYEKTHKRWPAA